MASITKEPVSVTDDLKVVRLTVSAGEKVPEHHSNVDVVATVVRGEGSFTVDGQTRAVSQGDVIVMRPKVRHAISATSELELVVVHARLAQIGEPAACGA